MLVDRTVQGPHYHTLPFDTTGGDAVPESTIMGGLLRAPSFAATRLRSFGAVASIGARARRRIECLYLSIGAG